ncbi:DUF3667 domain-containing protein [Aquimarina algiphila]|uniref:DUF3667 domain-containing protein n=1 Tax=Aquimarina algiphila TaxID=2047982 RepID=UPI00232D99A6|nr:DUF3667 domain-containing protein [Aquimarina algiphila]
MNELIPITNCKNCNQQIETYNFCPNCGAKKINKRITFKNLLHEFADRFLNLDNSFFRTFLHLFTKPNEVIDGFINGLRKRYINAFSYFAISITITGIYSFLAKNRLAELMNKIFSSLPEEQIASQEIALDFTFKYQSLLNLLLIPVLALLSRLVFWNYKKYNLTEHFVIYLYAYSHIVAFMTIILLPITFWFDNIFNIMIIQFSIYIIYITYVLKRLYQINLKRTLIKTLLFFFFGVIFYLIIGIIIGLIMAHTGAMEIPAK